MKTIKISIRSADLFRELQKITAYAGIKNEQDSNDCLDRVATVEADLPLLSRYRDIALSRLLERLRRFLVTFDVSEEDICLTLAAGTSSDDSLIASIQTDIFSYIISVMAARWFGITWQQRAAGYEADAMRHISEVTAKLLYPRPPIRLRKS